MEFWRITFFSFWVRIYLISISLVPNGSFKNLDPDPEKPGPWKTWTMKNLDLKSLNPKKLRKQLVVEKWLEEHII